MPNMKATHVSATDAKNRAERALNPLSSEFDAAVARMQTPRARAAFEAAFNASPARLGKAAVAAATPRDAQPRRAAKT